MNKELTNELARQDQAPKSPASLLQAFLRNYPQDAARKLESLTPQDAAQTLSAQPTELRQRVWPHITITAASQILPFMSQEDAMALLLSLDAGPCASLLSRVGEQERNGYLSQMQTALAEELRELLSYPQNTAGQAMDTQVLTMSLNTSIEDAMKLFKRYPAFMRRRIFTLDTDQRLHGIVELEQLVIAKKEQVLADISQPASLFVSGLDPIEDVAEILKQNNTQLLPVVDVQHRLLGVIRGSSAIDILKEDMTANLQTMVGASRDEQALSSSYFAFKKRQPWLQINLLTGFLAASIVGMFESTIAQFTALAVLMPVAAGQSGNTGAQALAVTMRGLTLREITTRHWYKVLFKEASAGFMNGILVAITCGAGVYLWSQSFGLALVIALAMIISMTIAGSAGALVPIVLKKFGQDPAQSSSIILTTVTDIAGFLSFLGIASAMSGLLVGT